MIPTNAPIIVAVKLTCSLLKSPLRSNVAPRRLSAKQPTIPATNAMQILWVMSGDTFTIKAETPIIKAPINPATVPSTEIPPSVPGFTLSLLVINIGLLNTPISLANVSAVAVEIAPINPA